MQIEKPAPLVPSALRMEVTERVAADGSIVTPLDEEAVLVAAGALRAAGVEAVAVCLLHSYLAPEHERRIGALLGSELPDVTISLSSDVLPEMREYERTSTTTANAFVQPVVARYLDRFVEGLRAAGLKAGLFIMLSEGGLTAPEIARRYPVRICESGPAAGAVTAACVARQTGRPKVLSFDMGGTTAKTALIHEGVPEITTDFEVARTHRFKRGSGLPLRVPVVHLIEIGAGGGSIVRVDDLGLLKVGPDSVGAEPGPACYGRGGRLPTVTDADLVLGYLGEGSFLGGRMRIDRAAARARSRRRSPNRSAWSVEQAALGIHAVVTRRWPMRRVFKRSRAGRTRRPTPWSPSAAPDRSMDGVSRSGCGSGPCWWPPSAGLGSALGLVLAPRAFRVARTRIGDISGFDFDSIEAIFTEMTRETDIALAAADVDASLVRRVRSADLRYRGQRKELTVDLPAISLGAGPRILTYGIREAYRRIYHRIHENHPIEALSWRLAAEGPSIWQLPERAARERGSNPRPVGQSRPMLFDGWAEPLPCAVHARAELRRNVVYEGPLVVEEAESTTLVGPNSLLIVDRFDNLVVSLEAGRDRP